MAKPMIADFDAKLQPTLDLDGAVKPNGLLVCQLRLAQTLSHGAIASLER